MRIVQRHSTPHPTPLRIPEGLLWSFDHVVAADPDGRHLWALRPAAPPPELKQRTNEERPGPRLLFRLEQLDFSTGEIVHSQELTYDLGPTNSDLTHFGFSLAPNGQYLCAIRTDKVQIFDRGLNLIKEFGAGLKSPDGRVVEAESCRFFPDTLDLLVRYWNAVMVYDWQAQRMVRVIPIGTLTYDAFPLAGQQAFLYHALPHWEYRRRITRVSWATNPPQPLWTKDVSEGGVYLHVASSDEFVFRGECIWFPPYEEGFPLKTDDPRAFDSGQNPYPGFPHLDGRIHSWEVDSGKNGPVFQFSGYWLHWPLAVSGDGRWLAVRATHYTRYTPEGEAFPCCIRRWDDMRFTIFDVRGSAKKPVYISENFGPDEAVIGLAFTPDGSTLAVVTTARLIIYDIKEATANKDGK